jgi:hypothetical protein
VIISAVSQRRRLALLAVLVCFHTGKLSRNRAQSKPIFGTTEVASAAGAKTSVL